MSDDDDVELQRRGTPARGRRRVTVRRAMLLPAALLDFAVLVALVWVLQAVSRDGRGAWWLVPSVIGALPLLATLVRARHLFRLAQPEWRARPEWHARAVFVHACHAQIVTCALPMLYTCVAFLAPPSALLALPLRTSTQVLGLLMFAQSLATSGLIRYHARHAGMGAGLVDDDDVSEEPLPPTPSPRETGSPRLTVGAPTTRVAAEAWREAVLASTLTAPYPTRTRARDSRAEDSVDRVDGRY